MEHRIALFIAVLLSIITRAQEEPRPRDYGHRVLVECADLKKDEWRTEVAKLATVPPSDSLYTNVLVQRVSLLLANEQWDDALAGAEEGIRIGGPTEYLFHLDKGAVLTGRGQYEEGMAYFDKCIERYPGSFTFRYLKVLSADEHKDHALALNMVQGMIKRFPLDPRGHALLAKMAQEEGRTAQAALAWSMALLVSWGAPADEARLGELDRMLGGETVPDPKGVDLGKDDDFTEIDLLLKNRVGMEKKYKVQPDLAFPVCRQSHLLFSYLQKNNTGTGFWSTFYVPLFRQIMDEGLFEGFVYHCLASSSSDKVNVLAKKNSADLQKFRDRVQALLLEKYQTYSDSTGTPPTQHWFDQQGGLYVVGTRHPTEDRYDGAFTLYHGSGAIAAQGLIGKENNRSGPWIDRDENGYVTKRATFNNGKEEGLTMTFFPDGSVRDSATFLDGDLQGTFKHSESPGALQNIKPYEKGKVNGVVKEFYPCGAIQYEYTMKDDLTEESATSYFADGVKQYAGTFVKGARSGMHSTWYHDGKKETEFTFENGKANGPYQRWHYNGALSEEGHMRLGGPTGPFKVFSSDSVLLKEGEYDESGRLIGLERTYDASGALYMEEEYQHGLLVKYRYFDRQGKMLTEGARKKGVFQFMGYSPDGNKAVSGVYLDEGLKDGTWTYCSEDGTINSEENFKKGEQTGVQRTYDSNGRLQQEINYTLPDRSGPFQRSYSDGKPRFIGWLEHGEINGTYRHYLPNGTLVADEYYVDGSRSGWQRYYDADGMPLYSERIENGALREKVRYDQHGKEYQRFVVPAGRWTMKENFPNGAPRSSIELVNGMFHGKSTQFFPNGKVNIEGHFVNSERDGLWVDYYPNGKKSSETEWRMGQRTGLHRSWYPEGDLWQEEAFENDEKHGPYRMYDRNGRSVVERIRQHGTDDGIARSWSPDGALEIIRWYDHDRLTAFASPNADGTPKEKTVLPQGIQEIKAYYPNGTLAREMHLRNGQMDGVYREYYPNGTLMEETAYSGGEINGTSTEYYENGKLQTSTEYVLGLRHGPYKRYSAEGTLLEETTFVYDDTHGEQKVYDASGKLIATYIHRSDVIIDIQ